MAFSRNSIRRVIGDMVHRNNSKTDSIDSPNVFNSKLNQRSRKKLDRISTISTSSVSLQLTSHERLRKSENDIHKSLNYLEQVLTHQRFEILPDIVTSLIETTFDIESILRGFVGQQSTLSGSNFLKEVNLILADLIEWSDQLLLEQTNNSNSKGTMNDRYKQLSQDLMKTVKNSIQSASETNSLRSSKTRSDSCQSFRSVNNSTDDFPPVLPPKQQKRPVNSSTTIISNKSRTNDEKKDSLVVASSSSLSSMKTNQDNENDAKIQLILDDINDIVENYTRELDEALKNKSTQRSPSIDFLSSKISASFKPSNVRHRSIDTLYETQISRLVKSTTTKTTIDDGFGSVDTKNSSNIYKETECSIESPSGKFQTQKLRFISRQKSKDGAEHENRIITSDVVPINPTDNDPPSLPLKQKQARAYMSLFDRYDADQAKLFLNEVASISTPQRRFEDLFEQLQQHFQQIDIFSNGDESQKNLNRNESSASSDTRSLSTNSRQNSTDEFQNELYLENVSHLLLFQMDEDPQLRGGSIDALIIRATSANKKDFVYQEAFLTTYRTFISPADLVDRLIQRYKYFLLVSNKQKIARHAFSLLIRVIDEIDNELTPSLMKSVSAFVSTLIRQGELQLGKLLRKKSFERFGKNRFQNDQNSQDLVVLQTQFSNKRATLLDFHSSDLSEQLTLLDSELFLKIHLSEVLYLSIEKGEEFSPNLALFTEHFNSISYWVRSRILEQSSQKQREVYFEKFLKILKHLRRLNNFNSYLAILSALDCGPVKRLPWSKSITDTISEHTDLIDSTGSFKNYREAFNSCIGQPCIPYIGLILSDLTFVHIGNADFLADGKTVNFWKRWQQFNILQKLRYCRKWEHKFSRNERILNFFNNFNDFMNEDSQWIQSEKIKPRQKPISHVS